MPRIYFTCQYCGARAWARRPEGQVPKYCSKQCKDRAQAGRSLRPVKWPITPEIHEQIKRVYQESTGNGEVQALAERLGYPRGRISHYAENQGWIAKQSKQPNWTEKELAILESNAHLSPGVISAKLRKAGFVRSRTAIAIKLRRMRFLKNLAGDSATRVAEGFGVSIKVVLDWIKKGYLLAERRGTERTASQGGDHYFIREAWVRELVLQHPELVDLRKVDKFWFIDLLAGNWERADDSRKWSEGEGYEFG